jgi:hypothetical protein
MNLKLELYIIIFFFSSILVSAQSEFPFNLENTASDVILAVASNNSSPSDETSAIYPYYYSNTDTVEFEKAYAASYTSYDSLKKFITGLKDEFNNINNDSALVLLNQYYLHISRTFYDYFKNKFFSSTKTKIIFFSASVSCPCTLEMCKNQLIDILKFKIDNNNKYDFWVIDSYWNNDLQIKYDTFFAPTVLVLNCDNEIIDKIEYEEQMINKLTNFLALNNKAGEK